MYVRDLVDEQLVIAVSQKDDVATAIRLLFSHHIGGLPVVTTDGSVVGFISERDIVKALNAEPGLVRYMLVRDVMRPADFCDADDTVEMVMRRMTSDRVRHLVVRDDGRMIGVVSVGDMVKYRLGQLELETAVLRDYLAGQRVSH